MHIKSIRILRVESYGQFCYAEKLMMSKRIRFFLKVGSGPGYSQPGSTTLPPNHNIPTTVVVFIHHLLIQCKCSELTKAFDAHMENHQRYL